jgi:hypothetical protein
VSLTWETVVTREVGSDRRLPVPERILSVLVGADPSDDARVFWSVAHDDDYLVVSDTPLRKPEYELVTDTTLYTDADSDGYRLRPPERVPENLLSAFYEGYEFAYLVYEEMATGDGPNSTLLLTEPQLTELLPGGNPTSDLGEQILDTPGFVPPPE